MVFLICNDLYFHRRPSLGAATWCLSLTVSTSDMSLLMDSERSIRDIRVIWWITCGIPFDVHFVYRTACYWTRDIPCAVSQWLACSIVHVLGGDVGVQCTVALGLAVLRCLAARARPCEIDACTDLLGYQFTTHDLCCW